MAVRVRSRYFASSEPRPARGGLNQASSLQPQGMAAPVPPGDDRLQLNMRCADVEATGRLAARLAPLLRPGDLVLLSGDLGAGKTIFTKALAKGLGVTDLVTSPTFTLMNSYRTAGGWDFVHVDAYRLESVHEALDLAIPETIEGLAVAVVEWGERAAPALGDDYLLVTFSYGDEVSQGENGSHGDGACSEEEGPGEGGAGWRELSFVPHGRGWQSRWQQVSAALLAGELA